MKQKKSKTKQKGITLIALVVTIVILMVLAGVSLSLVLGNNGLIAKAKESRNAYEQGAVNDETGMNNLYDEIESILGENSGGNVGGGTGSLPSTTGSTPYLPGSNFSQVAGTDLSTGLVIQDNLGNQYVWIEVPNDGTGPDYSSVSSSTDYDNIETALHNYTSVYRVGTSYVDEWYDGNGYTATGSDSTGSSSSSSSSSSSGSTIGMINLSNDNVITKLAMINNSSNVIRIATNSDSTSSSASGSSSSTSTSTSGSSSNTGSSNLNDTSGCGLTYVQYTTLKHRMLTSIYENGGFYIGRYETGIENSYRSYGTDYYTLHEATETPVIKANAYPYNWIRCSQAQTLASSMNSGNYTSSLMFGVQWDLVLAFMHNKGGIGNSTLTRDSTTIGNYYNNLWNITNTTARYSTTSGASWTLCPYEKTALASVLLTTGADASFGLMNIYDIAGNVWECTLEKTSDTHNPCAYRGGIYNYYGSYYPASNRSGSRAASSYDVGFRVTLY